VAVAAKAEMLRVAPRLPAAVSYKNNAVSVSVGLDIAGSGGDSGKGGSGGSGTGGQAVGGQANGSMAYSNGVLTIDNSTLAENSVLVRIGFRWRWNWLGLAEKEAAAAMEEMPPGEPL